MTGVRFRAPGVQGAVLASAAHAVLAAVGASAIPGAALLGASRYRRIERAVARAAWRAFNADLEVTGLHHVRDGPFVVVALHESLVDPLLLARLPLRQRFLARDEIWEWPHVGRLLRAGGHLSVSLAPEACGTRALLREAARAVRGGESIVVFPQGSVLGIEVAFRPGAFWLARRLGVPVLPVVITGTHRVWEFPFSPRLRRGPRVSLRVLEPVPADEAWVRRREIEERMRASALEDRHASPRRFRPERDGYWDGYSYEIAPEFARLAAAIADRRVAVRPPRVVQGVSGWTGARGGRAWP